MHINFSYPQEFTSLLTRLKKIYGQDMFDLEGIGKQLDLNSFAKDFLTADTTADVSVDANANVDGRDVIAYMFEMPKPFFRLNSYYLLWDKLRDLLGIAYADSFIEAQLAGDIYIHDFGDIGKPYCFNYSTYDIMLQGLPMVQKIKSVPPKHLYSFKSQIEQFVVSAANSTLGATGLADLFIVMSLYVDKIIESGTDAGFKFTGYQNGICLSTESIWQYVKENIVSMIYTLNQPMRGNQSPFTNVSIFDDKFLDELCPSYVAPWGAVAQPRTVRRIQEIYMEVMNEELRRTPVTFPVTTACFSVDENNEIQDGGFANTIAKYNKEFGFINIYCGKTSTLSSCCRLRSDNDNEYFNSFGAGSTKIGSLGVVTINLPRLAWKFKDSTNYVFRAQLAYYVSMAGQINRAKREIIKGRIERGNMPLYTHGFMDLSKQYSTVGVTGIAEAVEILGHSMLDKEGQDLVLSWLDEINNTNDHLSANLGTPHNCEQVPAENSSIKLANKDYMLGYNELYICDGECLKRFDLYSNQFIPLTLNADMLDRIKLQGMFDKDFSGGAICHINVEERIDKEQDIVDLIKHCAKQGVVYWAINYNLQECENGHMAVGRSAVCSICGADVVGNYTRVVGFLTNTKNWHKVRRQIDYPNRRFYGKI